MKKLLFLLAAVLCVGGMSSLCTGTVRAQEAGQEEDITVPGRLMKAAKAVEAKEVPKDDADTVIEYDKGAIVYVIGENPDGWYKVSYQDKQGYIRKASLTEVDEINTAGLDAEMEVVEAESKMVVEEVERYRAETKRSRVWGTVIVLLIAGIFAVGVISTRKSKKNSEKEESGKQ